MSKELVWLVTGCSSGFGSEFIERILARGDKAIATARKTSTLVALKEKGAATLQLDVTDTQQNLNDIVRKAIDIYGRIDVLVNNAGRVVMGTWEDLQ